MARALAFVILACMAVSAYAQFKVITFTRKRLSLTPDPETTAKPGTSLAATYNITTATGCTGKLYQTATYATVDVNDWEATWANFELSFYFDACPGTGVGTGYLKGAIFAAGLGTAIAANSSYPKAVIGGFEGFSKVTSGQLQRISTTPTATYTLRYK